MDNISTGHMEALLDEQSCGMTTAEADQVMKILVLLLSMVFVTIHARKAFEKPGCHKLGHTRTVYIPGCVAFPVTTNACRGFCTSWAVPSAVDPLTQNNKHPLTSIGECCGIEKTHDVVVKVRCLNKEYKTLTFKSAASCSCSKCQNGVNAGGGG